MSKIWDQRKKTNDRVARDSAQQSKVLTFFGSADGGSEWRAMFAFDTKVLVKKPDGSIAREGPIVIGVRYHEGFLSEAPHPFEIVTILNPFGVFHPNCDYTGAMCLGHPEAGISMELILNQVWAGLMLNMKVANTRPGDIVNPLAAAYVRDRAHEFPITPKGLFEDPDEDLRNAHWYARFDPKLHNKDPDFFDGGEDRDHDQPVDE